MSLQKVWDIILVIFSVYWAGFFLLDYWDKHPNHVLGIQYFKYTRLCVFLSLIGFGLSFFITKFRTGLVSKFYNGLSIYLLGLITLIAITVSFNKYINLDIGVSNYLHLFTRLSTTFFSGFLIVLFCFSIGNFILSKFFKNALKYTHFSIDFGLGAIITTLILFFLGSVGQLKLIFLLPISLLFIAINWRSALQFVLRVFIKPINVKEENSIWGYVCLYILFVFLLINFLAIDLPFPLGFDSRNLYINIANQLGNTNHLVSGYQPYSWSLFLSQGFILFDRIETTLFLSFLTGVICLFTMFHVSRSYFKLSFFHSSLLVLTAGLIPTFANQFYVELKTDFGLVLFQLLSIVILMELFIKAKNADQRIIFGIKQKNFSLLVLLGLFIGFGLAIKLLNLFLIYALVIAIWANKGKSIGTIGLVLIMFALVLILGLNNISGLGRYHLGNEIAKWIYLLAGTILFVVAIVLDKNYGLLFIKKITTVGLVAILPLLPWVFKNYIETRSLSPTKLLLGEPPGPEMNIFIIDRKLKNPN